MISKKSILTHNNLQVKGILSNSSSKAKLKKISYRRSQDLR